MARIWEAESRAVEGSQRARAAQSCREIPGSKGCTELQRDPREQGLCRAAEGLVKSPAKL